MTSTRPMSTVAASSTNASERKYLQAVGSRSLDEESGGAYVCPRTCARNFARGNVRGHTCVGTCRCVCTCIAGKSGDVHACCGPRGGGNGQGGCLMGPTKASFRTISMAKMTLMACDSPEQPLMLATALPHVCPERCDPNHGGPCLLRLACSVQRGPSIRVPPDRVLTFCSESTAVSRGW
jgi:hypothetical protein